VSDFARSRERHTLGLLPRPELLATFASERGPLQTRLPPLNDVAPLPTPRHPTAGETRDQQAIARVHRPAMIGTGGGYGEIAAGQ
jgi:hypothetical protein